MTDETNMAASDPAEGLRAVMALRVLADRLEAVHVRSAREQGWSWQGVADALDVSRQAVHHKYNRREGRRPAVNDRQRG